MSYLAFCEHNHSCDHMHGSLESQMKDERRLLHSSETGRACCVLPHGVDFLCMGTPCPPFSRQRPKRFASGTVKQHRDANTTFMHAGAFLEKYEPRVAVLEQVEGFIMPMAAGETDTPLTLWPCQALFFFRGGEVGNLSRSPFLRFRLREVIVPNDCINLSKSIRIYPIHFQ